MVVQQYNNEKYTASYLLQAKAHKNLFLTAFKKAVKDFKNKKILDIGCGDAGLTIEIVKLGAKVHAIDKEQSWINKCKEKYSKEKHIKFELMSSTNLKKLKNKNYDIVIMNMVIPNIDLKHELNKTFSEINRVLKKDGLLILSDLNPVGIMYGEFLHRSYSFAKDFSYFKDGSQFKTKIIYNKKQNITFIDRHWTLETITTLTSKQNLYLYKIIEPKYKKLPSHIKKYAAPEFIIFCCKKIK